MKGVKTPVQRGIRVLAPFTLLRAFLDPFEVDLVPQLRSAPERSNHFGFSDFREVVDGQSEMAGYPSNMLNIHWQLPSNHARQVGMVEPADVASKGAEGDSPLLQEPGELLCERLVSEAASLHATQYRSSSGRRGGVALDTVT